MIEVIGEYFARDPHLKLLVHFAAQDRAGFDGVLDHARRMRLAGADLEDFDHRFAEMPAADRARWMYELIEKTCLAPAEVARNLYRMVLKNENLADS